MMILLERGTVIAWGILSGGGVLCLLIGAAVECSYSFEREQLGIEISEFGKALIGISVAIAALTMIYITVMGLLNMV